MDQSRLRLRDRRGGLGGLRARQPLERRSRCAGPAARGRRAGSQLLDPPAGRLFPDHLRHPLRAAVRHRALRRHGRAQHRLAARPGDRRIVVDQRADLHPRASTRISTTGRASAPTGWSYRDVLPHFKALRGLRGRRERVPWCRRRTRRLGPEERPSRLPGLGRRRRAVRPAAQPRLQRREHVWRRRLPAQHPERLARQRGDARS